MTERAAPGASAAELAAVALAGALQTAAFVFGDLWPLQLAAVVLLAHRVAAATPWRAAALGLVFGIAWLCAGTWWLFVSMHRYGGLPAWMAGLAVFALASFLSIYLAAAMAAVARWRSGSILGDASLFAAAWLLAELARGVFFTGFPWVATAYAYVDAPLSGYASWVGAYGIGALVAGLAAAIAAALPRHRADSRDASATRPVVAAIVASIAVLAAGAALGRVEWTTPTTTLTVSLLQGNVPQDEKFETRFLAQALARTAEQLEAAKGRLVVGPETVIPELPSQLDPAYWQTLLARFRVPGRAALLGVPLGDETAGYTNSAIGISEAAQTLPGGLYRYDKHHLVPFGEFIPTGFHWFTRMMNIPLGDFNRGPAVAPSFAVEAERVAPNICYEDLFGEELAARFGTPGGDPTIFANISNIGWFGETIAVEQHLRISRLRTLELERPMVRATNTGRTAVIDHRGRVVAALPPFMRGVLEASVEGRSGLTPFAWWASRFGLWPLWLAGVCGVAAAALRRRHDRFPRIATPLHAQRRAARAGRARRVAPIA